jgi:Concanavalin A-like lectin/glucanases superfamily
MTERDSLERELTEIVLAASAAEATEAQLARLSELVVADESLAAYTVRVWNQEAWLSWQGSQSHTDELLAQLALMRPPTAAADGRVSHERSAASANWTARRERSTSWPAAGFLRRRMAAAMSIAPLIGVGLLLGSLLTWWVIRPQGNRLAGNGIDRGRPAGRTLTSPYVARLVQGTACVWSPDTATPHLEDGKLRQGESLNLMEGLAEIELNLPSGGNATLQIEGPARMVLTADGTPSLNVGKFSAKVYPGLGDFTMDTPFGQVTVIGDTSLGVAVHGLDVEVHVFSGQATFISPWSPDGNSVERFTVEAGKSLQLSIADEGAMKVATGKAVPTRFTSLTSMASDQLEISREYVAAIKQAGPLIYWRFEEVHGGIIRNEVGDRLNGIVVGTPDWVTQGSNRAIEFAGGLNNESQQAYVESSDPLGKLINSSYSIEVWVKPSHYHLGTLVSLARNLPDGGEHGALLELGGPLTTPSTIEHPGRIRFLHRDPPSGDPLAGTSCFSQSPYELRRWEHVVAVKDGGEMRLYVNGEMVAKADDNTGLGENLTLLIGQLDRHRDWRRFVGQLDELAVYGRALTDAEIQQHFHLARPKKKVVQTAI